MKIKLAILISLMWSSLIVYSQPATQDSIVVLSKRVAQEVLKDLERLDHLDSLNALNTLKIEKLIKQTQMQDRVILGKQSQIFNLTQISINKDEIIVINAKEVNHWKDQYKKQRRQKFLVGGAGILLLLLVGL